LVGRRGWGVAVEEELVGVGGGDGSRV